MKMSKENIIRTKVKNLQNDNGLTLIEVISALLIISILTSLVLGIYMGKYRLFIDLKKELEQEHAFFRGIQVISESVRTAEKIEWSEIGVLSIYQIEESTPITEVDLIIPDKFYIDDKDHDGKTDLYREHLGVPSPVATGLERISCREVNSGLWEIKLSLRSSAEEEIKVMVRQRVVSQ